VPQHGEAVAVAEDRAAVHIPFVCVYCQPAFNLQPLPEKLVNIRHPFAVTPASREDQIELSLRTISAPRLESVDDNRGEWNVALSSFRLWRANLPSSIGTLADMDDTIIEINITLVLAAQFAEPHACKDRRDYKQRTPCTGVIYHRI
jgi:hypothetical protein